nr:phospholipase-like protein [Tanacetum cinerariifolium]
MQTQTSNTLHNAIMEAGGKDRPPMLAPSNYVQWKSRIKRYIDTKPNHELIHYCLKNPPYKFTWADKEVPISEGIDIYSIFDACPNPLPSVFANKLLENGDNATQPIVFKTISSCKWEVKYAKIKGEYYFVDGCFFYALNECLKEPLTGLNNDIRPIAPYVGHRSDDSGARDGNKPCVVKETNDNGSLTNKKSLEGFTPLPAPSFADSFTPETGPSQTRDLGGDILVMMERERKDRRPGKYHNIPYTTQAETTVDVQKWAGNGRRKKRAAIIGRIDPGKAYNDGDACGDDDANIIGACFTGGDAFMKTFEDISRWRWKVGGDCGIFDGAFGGVGDEEVVVGEGVVVTSSSLEMLTNSYLKGIMVSLIFLEGLVDEALEEFMVELFEEDDKMSKKYGLFNLRA